MKANEYIKNYGWTCAGIRIAEIEHSKDFDGFYSDLKRLVESHELVESYAGLESAKKELQRQSILRWINPETERLRVAIADVESCMEVNDAS